MREEAHNVNANDSVRTENTAAIHSKREMKSSQSVSPQVIMYFGIQRGIPGVWFGS